MKNSFLLFTFVCVAAGVSLTAQESKSLLHDHALPVIASPDFEAPLEKPWKIAKGKWIAKDGVMEVVQIPAEKHVPVLHHHVGLSSAIIECDFKLDKPGIFYIGCDAEKHVGRVIVNAAGMKIAEDSVKPSHVLAELKMPLKLGVWHHLRVEWSGDKMAASLDGKELRAEHDFLATKKSRSWIAAGKNALIRNVTISGEKY